MSLKNVHKKYKPKPSACSGTQVSYFYIVPIHNDKIIFYLRPIVNSPSYDDDNVF